MLGTGAFSLWKPEDILIYKKIGERSRSGIRRTLETEWK
jgi:hypothetical protein